MTSEPPHAETPGAVLNSAHDPTHSSATPRADDWRIGVWRTFLNAHAAVTRDLERELTERVGMSLQWYDVLLQLVEAPGRRLRMNELADRVLLSRSGLTRLVDRLQSEGYVRREPSPDDARGTFTILTDAGYRRLRDAAPVHLGGVQRTWLDLFSDPELTALGTLLARVTEHPVTEHPETDYPDSGR